MNATLKRFGHPGSTIAEYVHWVVMIRPEQVTLGCAIVAAKSACTSLGELTPDEAAELPQVIRDFERAIRRIAPVAKFNYLALMMIDPNPHLHAIPRYAREVELQGSVFVDAGYPKPPDLRAVHPLTALQIERIRCVLRENWQSMPGTDWT